MIDLARRPEPGGGILFDQGDSPARRQGIMARLKFMEIDGKRHLWRDVLRLRREQRRAFAKAEQPALFPLIDDRRPPAGRTAAGRYLEPSLFTFPEREA